MSQKRMKKAKRGRTTETLPDTAKLIEIKALNRKQSEYIKIIDRSTITIAEGSAGTGKTYLAALLAMKSLVEGRMQKIIICRPAVTAGDERLGFLPGNSEEKMRPFIQPIFDAFRTYWRNKTINDMLARGQIEIVPLAFMRGRRFRFRFIIADEVQNCTPENLLMILTRLGEGRKMVLTGDPFQSDIRGRSCFNVAHRILNRIEGVGFIRFANSDVVRHPLVEKILEAWPNNGINSEGAPPEDRAGLNAVLKNSGSPESD